MLSDGYPRMYPLYKNAYKRLFCLNIMALKGEKMKGFASILSSPKVSVGDLFLLKKENDRFPSPAGRQTLGNNDNNHCGDNTKTRISTLRDDDNNKGTIKAQ